jgi:hypothetical protein
VESPCSKESYIKVKRDYEWCDEDRLFDPIFIPLLDDLVYFEFHEVEVPEIWHKTMYYLPPGYYKIKYDIYPEQETGEFGEILASYDTLGDIIDIHLSPFMGRCIAFQNLLKHYFLQASYHVCSLFRKTWQIETDWGGAGLASPKMFLPKALCLLVFYSIKKLFSEDKANYNLTRW